MGKDDKLSINNRTSNSTLSLIQIGLMAALAYVVTSMIHIPVGNGAVLHLGDSIAFLAAILLGRKRGAVAIAIGMTLFDLLSPYLIWAPFTAVIKGGMVYIAATIAFRKSYDGKNFFNNMWAFVVAGIFMCTGYYIAGGFLNYFVYGAPTLTSAFILALKDVSFNILQVLVGMAIALPLAPSLKRVLKL